MTDNKIDFEQLKNDVIEQLRAGKPLLGKGGAFTPLLESICHQTLQSGNLLLRGWFQGTGCSEAYPG